MSGDDLPQGLDNAARCFIVDDERLGRQLVRNLSDATPHIDIVGEFPDGREALAAIGQRAPDVIFLDIKMPDVDGMSVARRVLDTDCLVVFVTAFEEHALQAFEVQAFDYLLKPVDLDRFRAVAERIRRSMRRIRMERFISTDPELPLRGAATTRRGTKRQKIRVPQGDTIHFIDPDKVFWFEAANQYVNIHASSGDYMISTESLNSLHARVDGQKFVRVHRSALINVDYARRIGVGNRSNYYIEMENGDRVPVSRGNRASLADLDIE